MTPAPAGELQGQQRVSDGTASARASASSGSTCSGSFSGFNTGTSAVREFVPSSTLSQRSTSLRYNVTEFVPGATAWGAATPDTSFSYAQPLCEPEHSYAGGEAAYAGGEDAYTTTVGYYDRIGDGDLYGGFYHQEYYQADGSCACVATAAHSSTSSQKPQWQFVSSPQTGSSCSTSFGVSTSTSLSTASSTTASASPSTTLSFSRPSETETEIDSSKRSTKIASQIALRFNGRVKAPEHLSIDEADLHLIHFKKTTSVMRDIVERHGRELFIFREDANLSFYDFGAAPGGFCYTLMAAVEVTKGYGISLPPKLGGYEMVYAHPDLKILPADIFAIRDSSELVNLNGFPAVEVVPNSKNGEAAVEVENMKIVVTQPEEGDDFKQEKEDKNMYTEDKEDRAGAVEASKNSREWHVPKTSQNLVHLINCDMQDLSMQRDQKEATGRGRSRRGGAFKTLPIWALTLKQFALGLGVLADQGSLIFRFGWRGYDASLTWYQDCAFLLFCFLRDHFRDVKPYKSEYENNADTTFYAVCTGFDREKFMNPEKLMNPEKSTVYKIPKYKRHERAYRWKGDAADLPASWRRQGCEDILRSAGGGAGAAGATSEGGIGGVSGAAGKARNVQVGVGSERSEIETAKPSAGEDVFDGKASGQGADEDSRSRGSTPPRRSESSSTSARHSVSRRSDSPRSSGSSSPSRENGNVGDGDHRDSESSDRYYIWRGLNKYEVLLRVAEIVRLDLSSELELLELLQKTLVEPNTLRALAVYGKRLIEEELSVGGSLSVSEEEKKAAVEQFPGECLKIEKVNKLLCYVDRMRQVLSSGRLRASDPVTLKISPVPTSEAYRDVIRKKISPISVVEWVHSEPHPVGSGATVWIMFREKHHVEAVKRSILQNRIFGPHVFCKEVENFPAADRRRLDLEAKERDWQKRKNGWKNRRGGGGGGVGGAGGKWR